MKLIKYFLNQLKCMNLFDSSLLPHCFFLKSFIFLVLMFFLLKQTAQSSIIPQSITGLWYQFRNSLLLRASLLIPQSFHSKFESLTLNFISRIWENLVTTCLVRYENSAKQLILLILILTFSLTYYPLSC